MTLLGFIHHSTEQSPHLTMPQDPTPPLTPERLKQLSLIPLESVSSPGFVVHLDRLEENCKFLASVAGESGAKILLALKGFACHATFPRIAQYLDGNKLQRASRGPFGPVSSLARKSMSTARLLRQTN